MRATTSLLVHLPSTLTISTRSCRVTVRVLVAACCDEFGRRPFPRSSLRSLARCSLPLGHRDRPTVSHPAPSDALFSQATAHDSLYSESSVPQHDELNTAQEAKTHSRMTHSAHSSPSSSSRSSRSSSSSSSPSPRSPTPCCSSARSSAACRTAGDPRAPAPSASCSPSPTASSSSSRKTSPPRSPSAPSSSPPP